MKRIIRKTTPVELLHAIYDNEGWKRVEGESMTIRCNGMYKITVDHKIGKYIAVRKKDGVDNKGVRKEG